MFSNRKSGNLRAGAVAPLFFVALFLPLFAIPARSSSQKSKLGWLHTPAQASTSTLNLLQELSCASAGERPHRGVDFARSRDLNDKEPCEHATFQQHESIRPVQPAPGCHRTG